MKCFNFLDLPKIQYPTYTKFIIYKNVLLLFTNGFDERAMHYIDSLSENIIENMSFMQYHKGGVSFGWNNYIPIGLEENSSVYPLDGDMWVIYESKIV